MPHSLSPLRAITDVFCAFPGPAFRHTHTHSREKKRQVCRKLSTDGQTRILEKASEYGTLVNTGSPVLGEPKDAFAGITFFPMHGGDTSSAPVRRGNGLLTLRRSSIYFWRILRCGMLVVSLLIHCSCPFSIQLVLLTAYSCVWTASRSHAGCP